MHIATLLVVAIITVRVFGFFLQDLKDTIVVNHVTLIHVCMQNNLLCWSCIV